MTLILSKKPVTIAEAKSLAGDVAEKRAVHGYFKTFGKMKKADADKLVGELRALNNPKLKEEHLVKIADFLPQDLEDVNKIVSDAGLTEEEANAILAIVKKY